MDDQNQLRLAQLLCSRLCHDLISPIGAINNGLEILNEDQSFFDEAVALIGQSNRQAASRLAYFRLAFGNADIGEQSDFSEVQQVAENYFADGKISLMWTESYPPNDFLVSKLLFKLILNLCVVATEALPRGGTLGILPERDSNHFQISLTGPGCSLDRKLPELLSGEIPVSEINVKRVVPYLCFGIAAQLGIGLSCEATGEDSARLYST